MRADADERLVQDILARARQPDPSEELVPPLDADREPACATCRRRCERDELTVAARHAAQALDRHWRFYDRRLADWRRDLQRVTARYSADAADLASRRAVWEATRYADSRERRRTGAPRSRGRDPRARSARPRKHCRVRSTGSSSSLAAATRCSSPSIQARRPRPRAIAYYDRRLFMIDSPPLWEAWRERDSTDAALADLEAGLGHRERVPHGVPRGQHEEADRGTWRWPRCCLPLLVWLSRRSRKLVSDDPDLQSSARVLLRPVSSWLVAGPRRAPVLRAGRADSTAPGGPAAGAGAGAAPAAPQVYERARAVAVHRHGALPRLSARFPAGRRAALPPAASARGRRC